MGSRKIFYIGCAEPGRRVIDTNGTFEAKFRGPARETGGRDMIAEKYPASWSVGSARA
jgi:hypothetical protein